MTNRKDPQNADFRATLPADLQDLDRELSGIRIEERPSFGPELEQELVQAWQTRGNPRSAAFRPWGRRLIAAGVAGLMIAGFSVPSARASVFQLVRTVAEEAFPGFFAPAPEPELPEITVQTPPPAVEEPTAEVVVSPVDASEEVEEAPFEFQTIPEIIVTFPSMVSRAAAERTIAEKYPVELREAGVEGMVTLTFWVGEDGAIDAVQVAGGAGNLELQRAAMEAVREIEFNPATRNGVPVGTYVSVDVHFFALTGAGIIGRDTTDTSNF